jgi:hypothetical protein
LFAHPFKIFVDLEKLVVCVMGPVDGMVVRRFNFLGLGRLSLVMGHRSYS